jgi:hypothetical protein
MAHNLRLTRILPFVFAIPLALTLLALASGQEPNLEAHYKKIEPKEQFKYKWKGQEAVTTAGVLYWEVPDSQFGTNGLDRNYTGYCAQVLVEMQAGKSYAFRTGSIYAPDNFNVSDSANPEKAAVRRVKYIQELYGRYFRDPMARPVNADEALAFQIALWKIIQEKEPAGEGDLKLDLTAGDFHANYGGECDEPPAFVKTAQSFLDSLSGDDSKYFENPDLRGRELIRLKGIPNANGEVAQSQIALRFAGGGGVGNKNLANALTVGNGLGGGPGGPGSGSPGVGTGNGGFLTTGTPSGSGFTTTPNTPPSTPPDGPPPNTPPDRPPINQPPDTPPTTPVPAPAGLLLGAIALGTLGTWRLGVRLLAGK